MRFKKLVLAVLMAGLPGSKARPQSVSYSPLFDNTTFSRSIDLSNPVGTIEGVAATSPSGAATYTIPVKTPPGTNGMAPQLSIVYNSQGGNGILGLGWSLSGLSVITRAGKDFYHDGQVSPVTYTNDDAFMLDGQRLVPKLGNNGDPGTTYRTEAESYSVITSNEAIGGGPRYFNVVSRDGTIMQYGYTDDARFVNDDDSRIMMWRLNKIQDVNGNYISFHYDNSDREPRISQIKYTGNVNTGLAPYLEINFEYRVRKDKNRIYDGGYSINSNYLLTKITVRDGSDIFKKYELNYSILFNMTEKSHLKSITEFAGDGTKLNDTRFKLNYGTIVNYDKQVAVTNIEMPTHAAYPYFDYFYTYNEALSAADFNGDGINELYLTKRRTKNPASVGSPESDINIEAYQSDGFGSSVFTKTSVVSFNETHAARTMIVAATNKSSLPYDYNGDGKADLFADKVNDNKIDKRTIYYSSSDASSLSFAATDMPVLPDPYSIRARNSNLHGDFDGDRNMDFMTIVKNSKADDAEYLAKLNFPKRGEYDQNLLIPASISYDKTTAKSIGSADVVFVIDYNGDGKSDILMYNKMSQVLLIAAINKQAVSYAASVLHWELIKVDNIYPADFNGDGKTDLLLLRKGSGLWSFELAYSKGTGGFDKVTIDHSLPECSTGGFAVLTGDFDASGTADFMTVKEICATSPTGKSDCQILLSDGYGKFFNIGLAGAPGDEIDNTVTPLVADINGDGVDDIVYKPFGENKLKIVGRNNIDRVRFIKEINDGFNRTTTFSYSTLTKSPKSGEGTFYVQGSGESYPVNNVRYPAQVVTAMTRPDGIGGTQTTFFSYENLRLHRTGRGLLGFEKVKSYNTASNMHTEAVYDLNRDFYVPYMKSSKTFLNGDPGEYSQSITNYDFTRIGSGYCFTQTSPSGSSEDLLRGTSSTYSNTYDADGNITNSTSTLSGDVTITTTTATNYTKVAGSPFFNAPSEITITTQRGDKPSVMDKTVLEYDAKGRPIHSYTNPNGIVDPAKTVHKYWTYDNYGNKTSDKDFVVGHAYTPYTSYEYDAQGRFMTRKTDKLGASTEYTTHKFWGKPLSVTGISGLTSTNTYDAWGKLSATSVPVSSSVSYTINYSDGWDPGTNQLFYTLVQDPSAPDVKSWYDQLGRTVKTQQEHSGGAWTNAWARYDARGNVQEKSNSYLPAETPLTLAYAYDERNRIKSETTLTGTTKYDYSFSGGSAFTTISLPDGKIKKSKMDASGKLVESDNGIAGAVIFDYDSRGNELWARMKVFSSGMTFINKEYDQWGRLVQMDDADAGKTSYKYNPFGQLIEQKDPKGKITYFRYETDLGRLREKELDGVISTYTYYGELKGYQLQQETVASAAYGTVADEYDYNENGSLARHSRNTNGVIMEKAFGYDAYGRPLTTAYSSGLRTRQHYRGNGALEKITTDFSGGGSGEQLLYRADEKRGDGQMKKFTRSNGLTTEYTYEYGTLTRMQDLSGVYDLAMGYDFTNGNLYARGDMRAGTQEFFAYDAADRLTSSQAEKTDGSASWPAISVQYDVPSPYWTGSYGRIVSKSDAGTYRYYSIPRNAVASITDPAGLVSHATQDITYTPFHKADKIGETISGTAFEENFVYDAGEDRAYSGQVQGGVVTHQRWYMGDYERDEVTGSAAQDIHYISGEGGLCAIVVKEGGSFTYYAAYTDHLGSIVLLTDDAGTPVYRQAYDPWGRERDPETWDHGSGRGIKPRWLTRGYTGHEMLPEYGLINMNGRIYDPLNGRMLRPDNYVQDPTNTQSYNRFSYCWNNPMKYTDPSGEKLAIPLIALGFLAESTSNLIYGRSNPFGSAWKSANQTVSEAGTAGRFTISKTENSALTAGPDIFNLGISIDYTRRDGDVTTSIGGGIGMFGPFAYSSISVRSGNWMTSASFGTNFDTYSFGGGLGFDDGKFSASYSQTFYGGDSRSQWTGGFSVGYGEFSYRIENDFLAFGHSGDRFRTQAMEIGIGNYTIGSYMETNDPKAGDQGKNDKPSPIWGPNKHGFRTWDNGKVYSAPLYVSYRYGNKISRFGYSFTGVQDFQQNGIHQSGFKPGNQNYYLDYSQFQKGFYMYGGYNNPYSLFGF